MSMDWALTDKNGGKAIQRRYISYIRNTIILLFDRSGCKFKDGWILDFKFYVEKRKIYWFYPFFKIENYYEDFRNILK